MQSFSFIPLMASEKKIFKYFFKKFSLSVAMATNQNQQFGQIHMVGKGLLQKHFCKTFFKTCAVTQKQIPISTFPIISLCKF